MADPSTTPPLLPSSIHTAYSKIAKHIHKTPLLTSKTLNQIASSPSPSSSSSSTNSENTPKFNIYFKCENYQRIGAFKARGAFHAIIHLIDELGLEEVRRRGVVTHSSGNHAQALALAASTFSIPAHIVMPKISTPSKIAGTLTYTDHVYFSGSTSQEREAMVQEVIERTGAILVPPYDHPDIILGQGTTALELDRQYRALKKEQRGSELQDTKEGGGEEQKHSKLRIVLTPLGGGGLLSGTCVYFSDQPDTFVVGCEPSYQGGNDGEIGFNSDPRRRVENVKTLTIADGLRTPVGKIPWEIFTSESENKPRNLEGIYSVTEDDIKKAMKLVLERMKVFIEPSSAVPLAVVLYNEKFRKWVWEKQQQEGKGEAWDIGIVFSGGNTTIDAILGIFGESDEESRKSSDTKVERAEGVMGLDGRAVAENVAG